MIDVHCHLLPEVDDGPRTIEASLQLARRAVEEGVTSIVVTPHAYHPYFETRHHDVALEVAQLQQRLDEEGISLTLYVGQEIRIFGELVKALESGEAHSLARSRYVLVELPSQSIPAYTEALFFQLQTAGYIPVIAHPERNRELALHPEKLHHLVSAGALSQVTTSSLTGQFGRQVRELALTFISNALSQIIASDAHNVEHRDFNWRAAKQEVVNELGEEMWEQHLHFTEQILANKQIATNPPRLPEKNWRGSWKW
ncbi:MULTISPECIES: CpsB/CapC family capsule biosynthesis tyrosine phosphatase [unclassified Exiguobacterium]|uniref:tyrosine-protein phosphatase n=1 Tax=unclassified Exiguobacterium TaxID=2644629 RepID=UPI001BEB2F41|nr:MULTISPECIES: CpsB/CapC family capsule biosynthesis tyrosine phosphatase [unclassified Exiguobacterium]